MAEDVPGMAIQSSLGQVRQFIARMPNLSTTLTKVLEVCNDPSSSPNDLNKVISLDPVLTGQVLRLINSAYCGFPGKTVSLTRAIIVLGLNTVKNLALATSLVAAFKSSRSLQGRAVDHFWEHSLRVGVTAKVIAHLTGVPADEQEEFFVAGLLHDLGKLPLMACFPGIYLHVDHYAETRKISSCQAERYFLNLDHCAVNRLIAEKWKLNAAITNALVNHHAGSKDPVHFEPLLFSVIMADHVANFCQSYNFDETAGFDFGQAGSLKLSEPFNLDTLMDMQPEIEEQIEAARIFLKISEKG